MSAEQSSESLLSEVAAALRAGDALRAGPLAEIALEKGIVHPILFTAKGAQLGQQRRHAEALAAFTRAEALAPPTAATRSAVGISLAELGRLEEAVEAFNEAIMLSPDSPQLHLRLAWAYELSRNLPAARTALVDALRLQPDNAAALGRLAYLEARSGAWPRAMDFGEQALNKNPNDVKAHLALAAAETELDQLDRAEQRLTRLLAMAQLGPNDRYLALGTFGDVRDRQNRPDEAIALYSRANDVRRAGNTPAPATMLDAVNSIRHYLETALIPASPYPSVPPQSNGPVGHAFLLGFLRSGTTLVHKIIDTHAEVNSLEEQDTLADATRAFLSTPSGLEKLWHASDAEIAHHREIYWNRVRQFGGEPDGKLFVDKFPINTVKLPLIARLFPEAKILFAIRDPRDVVLSCFRRRLAPNPTTDEFHSLESTARFYDAVMRLAQVCRSKLPMSIHDVYHEKLVRNFEYETKQICDFLGLKWDEGFRRFARASHLRAVTTPSAMQLAKGLNEAGIGQWKRYTEHLQPLMPLLDPWVAQFGYS